MDLSYKSVMKYIFEQGEAVERFSANSSHLCHGVELSLRGVLLICTLLGSNEQLKMGLTVQTPDGFVMLISFDKGKTVVQRACMAATAAVKSLCTCLRHRPAGRGLCQCVTCS